MNKLEYDTTWERIITHDDNNLQVVVLELKGDPAELLKHGPALVERLNQQQQNTREI